MIDDYLDLRPQFLSDIKPFVEENVLDQICDYIWEPIDSCFDDELKQLIIQVDLNNINYDYAYALL